jgi:hypothetical protein
MDKPCRSPSACMFVGIREGVSADGSKCEALALLAGDFGF